MTQTYYNHYAADVALHISYDFPFDPQDLLISQYKKLRDFLRIKRINWFTVEISWMGKGSEMTYLDFIQYVQQFRKKQTPRLSLDKLTEYHKSQLPL